MKIVKLFFCCVVLVCVGGSLSASMAAVTSLATGSGELNMAGQMKGNYLRDAFNNIQRIVKLQDNEITRARTIHARAFKKTFNTLVSLGKRVARIQATSSGQGAVK